MSFYDHDKPNKIQKYKSKSRQQHALDSGVTSIGNNYGPVAMKGDQANRIDGGWIRNVDNRANGTSDHEDTDIEMASQRSQAQIETPMATLEDLTQIISSNLSNNGSNQGNNDSNFGLENVFSKNGENAKADDGYMSQDDDFEIFSRVANEDSRNNNNDNNDWEESIYDENNGMDEEDEDYKELRRQFTAGGILLRDHDDPSLVESKKKQDREKSGNNGKQKRVNDGSVNLRRNSSILFGKRSNLNKKIPTILGSDNSSTHSYPSLPTRAEQEQQRSRNSNSNSNNGNGNGDCVDRSFSPRHAPSYASSSMSGSNNSNNNNNSNYFDIHQNKSRNAATIKASRLVAQMGQNEFEKEEYRKKHERRRKSKNHLQVPKSKNNNKKDALSRSATMRDINRDGTQPQQQQQHSLTPPPQNPQKQQNNGAHSGNNENNGNNCNTGDRGDPLPHSPQFVYDEYKDNDGKKKSNKYRDMQLRNGFPHITQSGMHMMDMQTLIPGDGNQCPNRSSGVAVQYRGYVIDSQMDASNVNNWKKFTLSEDEHSTKLGSNLNISGVEEAILSMSVGEVALVWIPSRLAWGSQGLPPQVPPGHDLLIEIKLVRIVNNSNRNDQQQPIMHALPSLTSVEALRAESQAQLTLAIQSVQRTQG